MCVTNSVYIGLCIGCSTMLLLVVCGFLTCVRISAIYTKPELLFAGQRYIIQRNKEVAENASAHANVSHSTQQRTGSSNTNDGETYRQRLVVPRHFTRSQKYYVTNTKLVNRNPLTNWLTLPKRHNGYGKNMNEAYAPNRQAVHNGKKSGYLPRIIDRLPYDKDQHKSFKNEQAKQGIEVKRFKNLYHKSISEMSPTSDIVGLVAKARYHIQPAYNGLVTNKRHTGNGMHPRWTTDTGLADDNYPHVIPNVRNMFGYRDERMPLPSSNFVGREGTDHHTHRSSIGFQMDVGTDRRRYSNSGIFYDSRNNGMSTAWIIII